MTLLFRLLVVSLISIHDGVLRTETSTSSDVFSIRVAIPALGCTAYVP